MLKIKDNVDLKLLERLGFKKILKFNREILSVCNIEIDCKWREMTINTFFNTNPDKVYELLFDLIQAGLVEKVGD